MKKIAVQKGLGPIKNQLENEGYSVKEFDDRKKSAKNYLNKFDAVVVTGESQNVMGIADTSTPTTIINADGMSPQDVSSLIESHKQ